MQRLDILRKGGAGDKVEGLISSDPAVVDATENSSILRAPAETLEPARVPLLGQST